ncbi:UMP-CMP kinase [Aphelenchoides bicaudatus]|nr:UMP-CMP kinase [Aphelenchoides bicaudatus]
MSNAINVHHNVVFVLGLPGSGKGTQCALINKNFGFIHLSAGDLLRAEMRNPSSEVGKLITTHMQNGTIVPVEITCKLIENAMIACGDAPGFLVDGFPRNQDNLDGWEREMNKKVKVHFVLNLVAPIDVCTQRCLSRGENRPDDNAESLKKRFVTHQESTQPIVDHFREVGLLHEIDTQGTPEEILKKIKKVFIHAGFQELVRPH